MKSIIAVTKHKILEIILRVLGSNSPGKLNPNTAQTANTANIPARAYNALPVILIEGNSVKSEIVDTSKINIGKKKT